VQKSGNRVRINVQLQEVSSGRSIWTERFDGTLDDIFELQDDVAQKVIDALKIELGPGESNNLIDVGTNNISAYDSYLLGKHESRKLSRRHVNHAVSHFGKAATLDPGFADAHGRLGWAYYNLMALHGEQDMAVKAQHAFEGAKAAGYADRLYPWAEIERMVDPALIHTEKQLADEACVKIRNPDSTWRCFEYIQMSDRLVRAGLFQTAIRFNELYLAATGYSIGEITTLDRRIIYPLHAAGRYEETIEYESRLLDLQPDDSIARGERATLYTRTGQYSKAEQDLEIINTVWPKNFPQFYHLFWTGELDAAREYFEWLAGRRNFENLYRIYGRFLLGDIEEGINLLEPSSDNALYGVPWSMMRLSLWCPQSIVDEVAGHPRYQTLRVKKGYGVAWIAELSQMVNELTDITGIHIDMDAGT